MTKFHTKSIDYSKLSVGELEKELKSRLDGHPVYKSPLEDYVAGEMTQYGIDRHDAIVMLLTKMDARPIR